MCVCVDPKRQWLLILEEAKRKKMALDNQRKETSSALQHDSVVSSDSSAAGNHSHTETHTVRERERESVSQ